MGMYDEIDYECTCPVCKEKVTGFQSKSDECLLNTLPPAQVDNFYSNCRKCGCWIEFIKDDDSENYRRTVKGKWNGTDRPTLHKHTKLVSI